MTDTKSERTEKELIEDALEDAKLWMDVFRLDGQGDLGKVHAELRKRTHDGEPVLSFVVRSPQEVVDALVFGATAWHALDASGLKALINTADADEPDPRTLTTCLKFIQGRAESASTDSTLLRQLEVQVGRSLAEAKYAPPDAEAASLIEAMNEACQSIPSELSDAYQCVWDYYLMAFYGCAYAQSKDQSHEFGRQSFYDAFAAGLGFFINMGSLAVGVLLPEAHIDEEGRLHKVDGPAIVWGDEDQYWWRGTKVDKSWIMDPSSIEPTLGLTHNNVEMRRVICEIIGYAEVFKHLDDKKTIDMDDSPYIGELIEVQLPDADGPSRFLCVLCPTGRLFTLPVPETMQTAAQANAWLNFKEQDNHKPEVVT